MDSVILDWVQTNLTSPIADAVIPPITFLGEWGIVWLVIGACFLFSPKYRVYGIGIIAAVAVAGIAVNLGIKPLVDRPRPFVGDSLIELLVHPPSSSSFPSGHSTASFAAATVITFMPVKNRWKAAAFVLAILIAFSRLYLYVHYPSDVVGGMLLGIACGLATGFIIRRIERGKATSSTSSA